MTQIGFPRGETIRSIADRFDVHPATVYRWRRHETLPGRAKIAEIRTFTDEKVRAPDWYDTPAAEPPEETAVAA